MVTIHEGFISGTRTLSTLSITYGVEFLFFVAAVAHCTLFVALFFPFFWSGMPVLFFFFFFFFFFWCNTYQTCIYIFFMMFTHYVLCCIFLSFEHLWHFSYRRSPSWANRGGEKSIFSPEDYRKMVPTLTYTFRGATHFDVIHKEKTNRIQTFADNTVT